ncbi:Uncharacterised protein [Raoultella terrigena]|uniref:Uncharacterized protein n=1 Tax=Raoultella terrigena TaxID=577 RepID=A0A3P8KHT5_RAOTE|nr:Uncharacterised protein [Raoultella terrigena]
MKAQKPGYTRVTVTINVMICPSSAWLTPSSRVLSP